MSYVGGVKVSPTGQAYDDGIQRRLGILDVGTCSVAKVMCATGISDQDTVV